MILVDQPIWAARATPRASSTDEQPRRFAHLVSDESFEELHGFAARLGLPPRAFHRDHYDLPDAWWQRAVDAGAVEVDPRDLVRRLRGAGLRRRPGPVRSAATSS